MGNPHGRVRWLDAPDREQVTRRLVAKDALLALALLRLGQPATEPEPPLSPGHGEPDEIRLPSAAATPVDAVLVVDCSRLAVRRLAAGVAAKREDRSDPQVAVGLERVLH